MDKRTRKSEYQIVGGKMVRQNMLGKFEFSDDEPVLCDCGCRVEPGHDVQVHSFDVIDAAGNTKRITRTTCSEEDCSGYNIWFEVLVRNRTVHYAGYTEKHIYSAAEERANVEDIEYESQ